GDRFRAVDVLLLEGLDLVAVEAESADDVAFDEERNARPGADLLRDLHQREARLRRHVAEGQRGTLLAEGVEDRRLEGQPLETDGVGEAAGGDDAERPVGAEQAERAGVHDDDARELLEYLLDRLVEAGLAVDGLQ